MKIYKEELINRSFVLTSDEIERIAKHFDNSDHIIFNIICADKIIREYKSATELISFENPPNKEIESLRINVYSKNFEDKALLYFSKFKSNNIFISLKGEERNTLELMEFLHERLYAMTPWYSFIARLKFSGSFISFFITLMVTIPISLVLYRQFLISSDPTLINWIFYLVIIIGLGQGINFLWGWVTNNYFPMGVFEIGQEVKRNKDKDTIRTTIIGGFIISLLASVVFLILYR